MLAADEQTASSFPVWADVFPAYRAAGFRLAPTELLNLSDMACRVGKQSGKDPGVFTGPCQIVMMVERTEEDIRVRKDQGVKSVCRG